jgi:sigma-B regulation protein RsbU (phosphoserine phosphatase)
MEPNLAEADATPRVLVVDDDAFNRESLSRRLSRRNFEVETAVDGQAALDALEEAEGKKAFDLVLLDVMMPGLSGLEVLQRLRQTRDAIDLPIIMATAQDASSDVVEALGMGANDYVTKPLDFPVVLARVETQIALRRAVQRTKALEKDLTRQNAELVEAARRSRREMDLAAKVQATYLPKSPAMQTRSARFDWLHRPCEALAGDSLNICQLSDEHVAFYLFDVTGHGVAASLTAVSAARLLTPADDPNSILVERANGDPLCAPGCPVSPDGVARQLNTRFAFTGETMQFLTLFYAVLHEPTRSLSYVCAGHPPPLLVRRGQPLTELETTGSPVGLQNDCESRTLQLAPGDRLLIYSDGAIEAINPSCELFGVRRLQTLVASFAPDLPPDAALEAVVSALADWRKNDPAEDDLSLLLVSVV